MGKNYLKNIIENHKSKLRKISTLAPSHGRKSQQNKTSIKKIYWKVMHSALKKLYFVPISGLNEILIKEKL